MARASHIMKQHLNKKREYMIGLEKVANDISKVLKDNFLGFYIIGSFVMGDWNPKSSDIDFIVITRKPLNKKESVEIGKLHLALSKSDLGMRLDGAYTYLEQMQQKRFKERTGSVENHEFKADCPCHISADNILCLLQYGKCIQGVPIEELSLSVSDEELSQAVYDMLLEDLEEIERKKDFKTLYDNLIDILRCIYTLETGKLPTKPRAVEHCRNLIGKDLYENIKSLQNGKIDKFDIDQKTLKRIAAHEISKREDRNFDWKSSRGEK
jgi:streptomycin 3"-adenylyltransferase